MSSKKIIILSLITAFVAEIALTFIIYLNPYRISPLINPNTHMWINAGFNFLSFISLLTAFFHIKNKKIKEHKLFINVAFIFSALFLISYILYHLSVGHVIFPDNEWRSLYLVILGTHLICSFISLPLVFMTYALGFYNHIKTHKKMATFTFGLWSYVSITGVIVVFFLKFLK